MYDAYDAYEAVQSDPDFPNERSLFDIREQLTALWKLPYSQQLAAKFGSMAQVLHLLTGDMARRIGESTKPKWLEAALAHNTSWQPCCPIEVRRAALCPCHTGRVCSTLLYAPSLYCCLENGRQRAHLVTALTNADATRGPRAHSYCHLQCCTWTTATSQAWLRLKP
jgi:hypothetical protein